MYFTNPIWLWALTGITIPVAIHLLSRKEGKVIYMGSIRHLQETSTQQFKGIRLNELVLLVLRCMLIILFVLLLCGLTLDKVKNNNLPWVVVERGLEMSFELQLQLNKFQQEGYEVRLLAPDFPLLSEHRDTVAHHYYYRALIEELSTKNVPEVIVFSKNSISEFAGLRSSLPESIKWIGVPTKPEEYILSSFRTSDSIVTRTGYTGPMETHFSTVISSILDKTVTPKEPLRVCIVSDKNHEYDKKIIAAVLKTLEKEYRLVINITLSTTKKNDLNGYDWIFWLFTQPANNADSTNTISIEPGLEKDILIQKTAKHWAITKPLNEETALNENLTLRIASLIIPNDHSLATEKDKRMVPDSIAWSNNDEGGIHSSIPFTTTADSSIITIFLVILLIERMLAYYKNQ
jgi:hypothetical protein